MTRNELTRIVTAARSDLADMIDACPEIRITLHGAMTAIDSALAVARAAKADILAVGTLRGCAQTVGEVLTGALARHPEIGARDSRVRDVAAALVGLKG